MADIGVDFFVSNITEGLASPNKYRVQFDSPIGSGVDSRSVAIMCNVANLPGRSLKTYENRHYGVPFKLPFTAEYSDITFSFITQLNFKERQFFEDWQEKIVNPSTGLVGFYDDYKGDIIISHLSGKDGFEDYEIKLYDAYPVTLSDIGLGYSMTNEIIISGVTFTYRYWKRI